MANKDRQKKETKKLPKDKKMKPMPFDPKKC